jgi:hypothetical protein
MSEGPIKQWRDSWKPPIVSTSDAARVCALFGIGSTACGRKKRIGRTSTNWGDVTCADCQAARNAPEVSS